MLFLIICHDCTVLPHIIYYNGIYPNILVARGEQSGVHLPINCVGLVLCVFSVRSLCAFSVCVLCSFSMRSLFVFWGSSGGLLEDHGVSPRAPWEAKSCPKVSEGDSGDSKDS